MNLNDLLKNLEEPQRKPFEEAKQRFPEFERAANEHLESVRTTKEVVVPYETKDGELFKSAFKEVSGLSNEYGKLVRSVLPERTKGYFYLEAGFPYWVDKLQGKPQGML